MHATVTLIAGTSQHALQAELRISTCRAGPGGPGPGLRGV